MKTRKSILKRIKCTGSGKIMRGHTMANHLRTAKSKRQIRKYNTLSEVLGDQGKKLRQLIGA